MLQENSTDQMKPLMEADGETTHAEILHSIKLTTTLEPWYSGAPEIYFLYSVGENETTLRANYTMVDEPYLEYQFSDPIIFYYNNTPNNMYWKLVIREEDFDWGDYINFTVTGSFTWEAQRYNIRGDFSTYNLITNEDDTFGESQIYFYHSFREMMIGGVYVQFYYSTLP